MRHPLIPLPLFVFICVHSWLIYSPAPAAPPTTAPSFTDADYTAHIAQLRKTLPNDGADFAILIQKPFVVIGDEDAGTVKMRARQTIQWAVEHLKADFFAKDPDEILDIYLFNGNASYRKYAKVIFDDDPDTPYGYYSPAHKALIMNIATGGGTLVHEIVHPFMRANFPDCPPWFNEGLGSLCEQSAERDGHIIGLTNWRLPILQDAIKKGPLPTFERLAAKSNNEFYHLDRGTNYAQSRYLVYYLQEKGLLIQYYKDFLANQKDDPTGYKTLQKTLEKAGEGKDMAAFQVKWQKWAMNLTFP